MVWRGWALLEGLVKPWSFWFKCCSPQSLFRTKKDVWRILRLEGDRILKCHILFCGIVLNSESTEGQITNIFRSPKLISCVFSWKVRVGLCYLENVLGRIIGCCDDHVSFTSHSNEPTICAIGPVRSRCVILQELGWLHKEISAITWILSW